MTYRVTSTIRADADIDESYQWLTAHSVEAAERWLERLDAAVHSLSTFPKLHGRAREGRLHGRDMYQIIYRRHRVIYYVTHDTVIVVACRRVERRNLDPDEL